MNKFKYKLENMKTSTSEFIEALYENYAPRVDGEACYIYGDVIYINFGYGKIIEEDIKYAAYFARKLRKKLGNDAVVQQRSCRVIVIPDISKNTY